MASFLLLKWYNNCSIGYQKLLQQQRIKKIYNLQFYLIDIIETYIFIIFFYLLI